MLPFLAQTTGNWFAFIVHVVPSKTHSTSSYGIILGKEMQAKQIKKKKGGDILIERWMERWSEK